MFKMWSWGLLWELCCVSWEWFTEIGEREASLKVQAVRQKDSGAFHVEALGFSLCLPLKARD